VREGADRYDAARRKFGLAATEVPVMLLSVGLSVGETGGGSSFVPWPKF
jgi:hypothetical protein